MYTLLHYADVFYTFICLTNHTFPSNYTCVTCGTRYCCVKCLGTHLDTRLVTEITIHVDYVVYFHFVKLIWMFTYVYSFLLYS